MLYKTVLGVDPGIANLGYAIVRRTPKGFILVVSGLIKTPSKIEMGGRLKMISDQVLDQMKRHTPDLIAIERVFHNRNISSSLKTAKAIGVIELLSAELSIPAVEILPQQVKSVLGLGRSMSKEGVQIVVSKLFNLPKLNNHVADAAACAIAGFQGSHLK